MNAPVEATTLAQPKVELIPITAIAPATTHIQQLRRKHFDSAKLDELVESIKSTGLLQPILVRPHPSHPHVMRDGSEQPIEYEIVAGERRWIACERAGYTTIAANIRELTDTQVLEAQLIENLQREDVSVLEEAEGYRELMELKQITAEELAAFIGKSRSYVYARRKLLDLSPEAHEALEIGQLDASKALLIARIRNDKLQAKALQLMLNSGNSYSYRTLVEKLRDDFMANLDEAPFPLEREFLDLVTPKFTRAGMLAIACTACPHNSGNDPELQAAFDKGAHVCTHRPCFEMKRKAWWGLKRQEAEATGRKVLAGEEATSALPDAYYGVNDRYLDLDARVSDMEYPEPEPAVPADSPEMIEYERKFQAWEPPTYRQLLADLVPETVLCEDKKGAMHELVPVKDAAKLLKTKGIKLQTRQPMNRSIPQFDTEQMKLEREQQEERQEREVELRRRVLTQIHAKWKPPLKRADLQIILDYVFESGYETSDVHGAIYGGELPKRENATEAELARLLIERCIAHQVDAYGAPTQLFEVAKRLKIDPAKIKKEIATEAKRKEQSSSAPTDQPLDTPPAAPAKKSVKAKKAKAAKK